MTQSARLGALFLQAAQAQKETTVNEGFAIFDLVASAAIDGFLVDDPPASPSAGACYIVGASPTGAWSGHALALAGYTVGGWRFVTAIDGLACDHRVGSVLIVEVGPIDPIDQGGRQPGLEDFQHRPARTAPLPCKGLLSQAPSDRRSPTHGQFPWNHGRNLR